MDLRGRGRHFPLVIAAALLVLLSALATLQYRWIGQVSELEQQRMEASLRTAAARFADDFDRELARALAYFHGNPLAPRGEELAGTARQLEHWLAEAPFPELVRDIHHASRDDSGAWSLRLLRRDVGRFEPRPWPAGLEPLRRRLEGGTVWRGSGLPVDPELAGLVIPFPRVHGEEGFLIVRFDRQAVEKHLLPALAHRHFEGLDSDVAVLDGADPPRLIYSSNPDLPQAAFRSVDVRQPLFTLRPFEGLRGLHLPRKRRSPHFEGRFLPFRHSPPPGTHAAEPAPARSWWLVARHRDGSLQEAVARVRRHNLTLSAFILVLLAAAIGLLVAATQRLQRVARQQIEFVAGVTHELNTPLAAIRSAGQNLADGVIEEPGQVRRYGTLIVREGRRLSSMVAEVLELAGIQSGRRNDRPQPVVVSELVEGALADCRELLETAGVRVEVNVPAGLPPVLADPEALRRALRNLVENAVKHGGSGKWVRIRARAEARQVVVGVEDRGPGIAREDLPRLFEPFFRGRNATEASVPGSGLGLGIVRYVVEAQGGRVTVGSGPDGQGAAFTLRLPAAPLPEGAVAAATEAG
jgi:signal transduction histidine kinase